MNWDSTPLKADPAPPAAGTDFTYTVPTGKVGRLYWLAMRLAAGGQAPNNRYFQMEAFHNKLSNPFTFLSTFLAQFKTETVTYMFAPRIPDTDGTIRPYRTGAMPKHLIGYAGDQIFTLTTAIQSLDQWTVSWGYKERSA
jgi:hypothetical protein